MRYITDNLVLRTLDTISSLLLEAIVNSEMTS
jgi:hypothetical protein